MAEKPLYKPSSDYSRAHPENSPQLNYRSGFRKDYGRLVHSASFRRLTGKTQLFPGIESDYFRNRLTHSLEVAQIAKSIALKINTTHRYFKKYPINLDLAEFSALAHDLGHPPFGHIGERALDECMKEHGGFEGNAQTLRILGKIEKKIKGDSSNEIGFTKGKDKRFGLNLTFRSLASILKYDHEIPESRGRNTGLSKGYYLSETPLINQIKRAVTGKNDFKDKFKTVECQIMDIADDIAYSTFDLEDALKANFINPLDFIAVDPKVLMEINKRINIRAELPGFTEDNIIKTLMEIVRPSINPKRNRALKNIDIRKSDAFVSIMAAAYSLSKTLAENGYFRYQFSSALINEFVGGVEIEEINNEYPALSIVKVKPEVRAKIEVLKYFVFYSITMSPRLRMPEYRGYEIVKTIFDALTTDDGFALLPHDYKKIYEEFNKDQKLEKRRTICDFIAGMTDRYVIEFYGRLKSENPQTIFKPY